jgi:hypothetical protein
MSVASATKITSSPHPDHVSQLKPSPLRQHKLKECSKPARFKAAQLVHPPATAVQYASLPFI